jgi:CDP-diacylglycerol--glycerol-3-phosphate 3-phosphatidyltransferase
MSVATSAANRRALSRLRLRWAITAATYLVALLGGFWYLGRAWGPDSARAWLLWAGIAMLVELGILWWVLRHNHPPNATELLPTFGIGTTLTLVCGLLLFLLAGFLFQPAPPGWLAWLPALLYTVARLVDYVDGYAARITHHETKLGGILDIEFDGLGVLIAILLAVQYGKLPLWYLPLALSRQFFIFGIYWRTRQGKPVYEMTPSANRRIIAGFQTGFVSVILWPIWGPPMTTLAAVLFALPLAGSFLRDWLVVSGAIDPESRKYQQARAAAKTVIEGWLPTVGRLVGSVVAVLILLREVPGFPNWQPFVVGLGAEPQPLLWSLTALFVLALPFFLLGIVGRVAAVPLIAMAALDITAAGLHWTDNAWLLIASIVVAHAGSGRLALWRPEDPILHRRPGEQRPATP